MQFFAKLKTASDELVHDKLGLAKEIAQHWIDEIKPTIFILKLYRVKSYTSFSPDKRALNQIERLRNIIRIVDEGNPEYRENNILNLARNIILQPFGRDIESVILTGKPILPRSITDISEFLAAEEAQRKKADVEKAVAQNRKSKMTKIAAIEDEKRKKREALEAELGVKLG